MIVSELITQVSYDLRNASGEFDDPELLSYLNISSEILYKVLVKQKSEMVRTGSDSFSTAEGTQSYDVTSSGIDITDLWVVDKIWVSEYSPMDVVFEEDLYDSINLEEQGDTGHRARPEEYCHMYNTIWFKSVPDAVYSVNLRYFPSYSTITDYTSELPYLGIFNQKLAQTVKLLAKSRNEMNFQIDAQLMSIFEAEALFLLGKRSKKNVRFSFDRRLRK